MKVKYESNNSGGEWWLKDEHWKALEAAGWYVVWGGRYHCRVKWNLRSKPPKLKPCPTADDCPGHRCFETAEECEAGNGRWLGALAMNAEKEFASPADAMREFEAITGMDVTDEGCSCCGPPHCFDWHTEDQLVGWEGASGKECVEHLYGKDQPTSLREAIDRLNRLKGNRDDPQG